MLDSRIANKNKIILNESNEIVNDCKILSISFRKSNDEVIDAACDMIKED